MAEKWIVFSSIKLLENSPKPEPRIIAVSPSKDTFFLINLTDSFNF